MTGRPSIRTETIIETIIERVTNGEPLAQVLRDPGMPKPSTFYDWLNADQALSGQFARAREFGADAIAVDALRIADTQAEGVIDKLEMVTIADPDDPDAPPTTELQVVERRREDMLGHRRLQVETRLKLLAKWDPKRYGDKLEVDNKGELTLNVALKRFTPDPPESSEEPVE